MITKEDRYRFPPRTLLLIDAAGALFSAGMLGVVLPAFPQVFGIPVGVLHVLAVIPLLFVAFDLVVVFVRRRGYVRALRVIAVGNLLYGVVSLLLVALHAGEVAPPGWAYLLGEIVIVTALAVVELRVASWHSAAE